MTTMHELLDTQGRSSKPRTTGITILLDTGLGLNAIEDLAGVSGPHADYAKIVWGSALITANLVNKLEAYRRANILPLLGGTLFEYCYMRGQAELLYDIARDLRVHVEISDGVIEMSRSEKLRWIEKFAAHGEVFSEVGGKIESHDLDWKRAIHEELSAGSTKVVIEGREVGRSSGEIREDFVDFLEAAADTNKLVFEALERYQQVWLIKRFGPNVNLGNIRPTELLTLESFRLGLKEHTLVHTFERSKASSAQKP